MRRALLLLPLAALAHVAMGEGAARSFNCRITQTCDAAGRCQRADGEVSFRMAPESLAPDGSGTYQISYRDEQASMEARSFAGPFYWTTDSERNSLLASSETEFLWHRLKLASAPEAEIHFLTCAVTN